MPLGDVVFAVDGLSHPTEFADISFDLRRGEILGFYGLVGSGRTELMQALFGVTRPSRGSVQLGGKPIAVRRPADAVDAGIVYVPEERQRQGVVLALPVFGNMTLPSLGRITKRGFLDLAREFDLARKYAARLDLRAASLSQEVGTLSGGNQQKVVIGKWLATEPRVIILDEPTKGIDVGSKAAVHAFMGELVAQGLAVIMVSSELPEVMGMSDRVIVMRDGRIAARFDRASLSAETLVAAATGNVPAEGGVMRLNRDLLLAAIVIVMIAGVGFITPAFVSPNNLVGLFNDTSILIMMALAQMAVILTKCIDLSVAANVALTGVLVSLVNAAYPGLPIPLLMVLATGIGLVLGAFNGVMVWLVGIPSIVVTLGTLSIYRGLAFVASNGDVDHRPGR